VLQGPACDRFPVSIRTAEVATSTARLKTGANDLMTRYVGRAEIFAPPTLGGAASGGSHFEHEDEHEDEGIRRPRFPVALLRRTER
jgi:hypothetical protein